MPAKMQILYSFIVVTVLGAASGQFDHRASESHFARVSGQPIPKIWVISKEICTAKKGLFSTEPNLPNSNVAAAYCRCSESSSSPKVANIVCQCNETENEAIEIQMPPATAPASAQFNGGRLRIANCSSVSIDTTAFAQLQRVLLELVIENVGQFELSNGTDSASTPTGGTDHVDFAALATGAGGRGPLPSTAAMNRRITFSHVRIPLIPPQAFPAFLDSVRFIDSQIETIAPRSFPANRIRRVLFANCTVGLLSSGAFPENTEMTAWTAEGTRFGRIESNAVHSSMAELAWTDSWVGRLESGAVGGIVANVTVARCTFGALDSHALAFRGWSRLSILNNTFEVCQRAGVDLTKAAGLGTRGVSAKLSGNEWGRVEPDFIVAGGAEGATLVSVESNTFTQLCDCGAPTGGVLPVLLSGSAPWLQERVRNASRCATTQRGASCLGFDDLEKPYVRYSDWDRYCSTELFLCINELSDSEGSVGDHPSPTSSKLRVLVIVIGGAALTIVACLIGVLCIYMCGAGRREKGRKPRGSPSKHKHRVESKQKLSPSSTESSPPHSYVDLVPASKLGGMMRPRSMLLQPRSPSGDGNVEMEDKGVQTMPPELSTDVLEELRGKLAAPDSVGFWEAKETIDHLYDLIQVQPPPTPGSGASPTRAGAAPPDVTMCNQGNGATATTAATQTQSPIHAKPVPFPRYAQVRGKSGAGSRAPICDYGEPPDANRASTNSAHLYSELNQPSLGLPLIENGDAGERYAARSRRPIVCEYTEPQDACSAAAAASHVYAELGLGSSAPGTTAAATQSLHRGPHVGAPPEAAPRFLTLRPLPSIPATATTNGSATASSSLLV